MRERPAPHIAKDEGERPTGIAAKIIHATRLFRTCDVRVRPPASAHELVRRHVASRKFRAEAKIVSFAIARNARMVQVRDGASPGSRADMGGSSDQEPIDAHCSDCASHGGDSAEALWRHGTRRSLADRRTGGARS